MQIHEKDYSKYELMRRVGSLAQVGGVQLLSYEEGHSRGLRGIEFRTGSGFRFMVIPDRGFDVGFAEYQGVGLCWLPPKLLAGPWFYEGDLDGTTWLRVGLGGLFNTAGLVSIGTPEELDTAQFGFTQRMTAHYGTHDRIAVTPASHFTFGDEWVGDRCLLWAEGIVRQDIAYGENLSVRRRLESELGGNAFRMVDVVTNEGWFPTYHQRLYHFNAGFPMVNDGAEVLASVVEEPAAMHFSTEGPAASPKGPVWRSVTAPQPGFTHEGYVVPVRRDERGWVAVAIVNRELRPELGGLGVYLRYDSATLPVYIAWRMMREGLYALGMEPATNPFGNPKALADEGYAVLMQPGEQRRYELEYGILVGREAIEQFTLSLPS
ncbi:MAG: DUF4432 family protein [Acidimicrobiales bacterium]|jgi:hypothetical protein